MKQNRNKQKKKQTGWLWGLILILVLLGGTTLQAAETVYQLKIRTDCPELAGTVMALYKIGSIEQDAPRLFAEYSEFAQDGSEPEGPELSRRLELLKEKLKERSPYAEERFGEQGELSFFCEEGLYFGTVYDEEKAYVSSFAIEVPAVETVCPKVRLKTEAVSTGDRNGFLILFLVLSALVGIIGALAVFLRIKQAKN